MSHADGLYADGLYADESCRWVIYMQMSHADGLCRWVIWRWVMQIGYADML